MFVPLQPVVLSVILCSLASALFVVLRARSKRLLGCSAAAGEGYKKAHLTFTDSEEKTGQPAAGCWLSMSSCFMRCMAVPVMCCRSNELSCKVQDSVHDILFLNSPGM